MVNKHYLWLLSIGVIVFAACALLYSVASDDCASRSHAVHLYSDKGCLEP